MEEPVSACIRGTYGVGLWERWMAASATLNELQFIERLLDTWEVCGFDSSKPSHLSSADEGRSSGFTSDVPTPTKPPLVSSVNPSLHVVDMDNIVINLKRKSKPHDASTNTLQMQLLDNIDDDDDDVDDADCDDEHGSEDPDLMKTSYMDEANRVDKTCGICNKVFKSERYKKQHVLATHMGCKSHACPMESCGKKYTQRANLKIHLQAKHGFLYERCTPNQSAASAKLISYEDEVKREDKTCGICGKCFKTRQYKRQHVLTTHMGRRDYVCHVDGCGKSYSQSPNLKSHLENCHGILADLDVVGGIERKRDDNVDGETVGCWVCGKRYPTHQGVKYHIMVCHMTDGLYHCPVQPQCSYRGADTDSYLLHLLSTHWSKYETKECPICGERFLSTAAAKQHISRYPCEIMCEECNHTLPNEQELHVHVEHVHWEEKYACTGCDRRFRIGVKRDVHMCLVHKLVTSDRTCPYRRCGEKYSNKSKLIQHIRQDHTNTLSNNDFHGMTMHQLQNCSDKRSLINQYVSEAHPLSSTPM